MKDLLSALRHHPKGDADEADKPREAADVHLHQTSTSDGDEYVDEALRMHEQPFGSPEE
ncbi:hypothetical protein [Chryseolinea lacunae]|uniref:DUF2795 domain-containing protein n=1 Tax=Chryseolinea lacunae TaxID=2801331 RepID=A0ABS1KM37_9BACT|nr:hypothetical protein [Chryseolinea lacunae]MBL0740529.1 hypothetical protein [Chryseolinea lacunae]